MTRLEAIKARLEDFRYGLSEPVLGKDVAWLIELVEEARRGAYRHRLDCESCRTWLARVEGNGDE